MAIVNHDKLLEYRKALPRDQQEPHYIMSEMIEPLVGGVILGGFISRDEDERCFPSLRVMLKGKVYYVAIVADDEENDGGRLHITEQKGEI